MPNAIRVGDLVLVAPLGRGGMGEVWAARHPPSGQHVAIKLISGPVTERGVRRFSDEVRAIAALRHPGILEVYDHGRVSEADATTGPDVLVAGSPYLVMERAPGTLADATPEWAGLERWLLQLLDALAYAHARGVVHLDVKPSNATTDAQRMDAVLAATSDLASSGDIGALSAAIGSTATQSSVDALDIELASAQAEISILQGQIDALDLALSTLQSDTLAKQTRIRIESRLADDARPMIRDVTDSGILEVRSVIDKMIAIAQVEDGTWEDAQVLRDQGELAREYGNNARAYHFFGRAYRAIRQ